MIAKKECSQLWPKSEEEEEEAKEEDGEYR